MSRLTTIKRLVLAALATGGIAFACRTTEAPPLAPRPDPVDPSANPVPGAPDPIDPTMPEPNFPTEDGGVVPSPDPTPTPPPVSSIDSPEYRSQAEPAQAPGDGGVDTPPPTDASNDAAVLPPVVDDAGPPVDADRIAP